MILVLILIGIAGTFAIMCLMYLRRPAVQRITYGPTECEECGLSDRLGIPSYSEWPQRSELEGRDFGRYYDRDGTPIDFAKWVWMREAHPGYKIIRHTHGKDSLISTVHLGMNHNYDDLGPPIIFETMVFGIDGWEDYQERYAREADAVEGHHRILAEIGRN